VFKLKTIIILRNIEKPENKACPTKRAPDGWDSPRFLEIVSSFGSFPFHELVLSRRR
jgi:hypothetical protein